MACLYHFLQIQMLICTEKGSCSELKGKRHYMENLRTIIIITFENICTQVLEVWAAQCRQSFDHIHPLV